ncbi:hypothetical protein ACWGB8_21545 [Kitasatospora sp. NPDC054939]
MNTINRIRRIRRWTVPAVAATALLGSLSLTGPAAAEAAAQVAFRSTAVAAPTAVDAVDGVTVPDTTDGSASTTDPAATGGLRAAAPKMKRAEMIRRAKVWLKDNNGKQVPYSQKKNWKDGYRQDCSGYVSMALKLPKSGPNTVSLKNDGWTKPIAMSALRQGDLVIKANSNDSNRRHVVIFDHWTDSKHTSYVAYEQAGKVGTRVKTHAYGLKSGDGYHAHRPVNLVD